jgi:hypothetical protein
MIDFSLDPTSDSLVTFQSLAPAIKTLSPETVTGIASKLSPAQSPDSQKPSCQR